MSEIVFILGAGASVPAGAPIMSDFLDRARDIWADPHRVVAEDVPHYQRVFNALQVLQAVHSKSNLDLVNIESVFTLLEMAELLQRMPGNFENPGDALSSLKKVIAATLSASVRFPVANRGIGQAAGYAGFVDMLQRIGEIDRGRHSISVVTFNYDLGLDFSLLGRGIQYGLGEEQRQGVPVFKLHGSLNWVSKEETGEVIPLMPDALMRTIDPLRWVGEETVPLNFYANLKTSAAEIGIAGVSSDPVIVPPTWKKGEHQRSLARVWQGAAMHLNEAQYIFVCGYSLPETDGFFKMLYALGTAGGQPLRTFHVLDPDPNVDQRFRALLGPGAQGRYRYQQGFFEDLPGTVLRYFGQ
ncbi:hypothetical protein [Dongia rigui]|uniref:SIR2-like domain-containing protein n=1 Tax=Dongia rigui TaxID=940149 RepID=A0ABU5E0P4_9PROT|nr:hypothetical protein [Dongia rigui]MDY0873101.1 hypothetical protein [Dongia rigui]